MRVAYVAGPYRDKRGARYIVENIRRAEAVALELWRMGYAAICPHKNTALFDGAAPDDMWLRGHLEILRRCDLVVVGPGHLGSAGTLAEIEAAEHAGIPVYYWERDSAFLEAAP